MSTLDILGCIIVPLAVIGLLVALFLAAVALTWALTFLPRRVRHPRRDGCPCGPCRSFDAAVREALAFTAEVTPGPGPHDGKRLRRREARALRGIETASEKTGACL